MSKVSELARAEAEAVEAEEAEAAEEEEPTPDEEPTPEPEPEPEPEVQAVDDVKLEKAVTSYFTALSKVLGPDMGGLSNCEHCSNYVPGLAPLEVLAQAPFTETCPLCQGKRMFKSGAADGDWYVVPCIRCNSKGYIDKSMEQPQPVASPPAYAYQPPAPQPVVSNGPTVPAPFQDVNGQPTWAAPDLNGRPHGHEDYGKPPAPVTVPA